MEGVVAGVPELADYDVIIDAGSDAQRSRERRPVLDQDAGGQDVQAARQLQLPDRDVDLRHRPEVRGQGRRARPRRRRQGRVRRGGPGRRLLRRRCARLREAREGARRRRDEVGSRAPEDAFTALVVMTPTMSEYFEAWKNSRFVAGDKATEKAFVAAVAPAGHRRHPQRPRAGLRHRRAARSPRSTPQQAQQTGASLTELRDVRRPTCASEEEDGKKFTAERGRHARQRGAEPRRGDRRPGLAGGRPARDQGRELGLRALAAPLGRRVLAAAAALLAPAAAAAARTQPPWRSADAGPTRRCSTPRPS